MEDPLTTPSTRTSNWSTLSTATTSPRTRHRAEALLDENPDLELIMAPTTVGIVAAAQAMTQAR